MSTSLQLSSWPSGIWILFFRVHVERIGLENVRRLFSCSAFDFYPASSDPCSTEGTGVVSLQQTSVPDCGGPSDRAEICTVQLPNLPLSFPEIVCDNIHAKTDATSLIGS